MLGAEIYEVTRGRNAHLTGGKRVVLFVAADDSGVQHNELDQVANFKVAVDLGSQQKPALQ